MDLIQDPELQQVLGYCAVNTKYCAKTLFPGTFYAPFSTLHDQIFEAIDSGHTKIAIAAPRGIGKTSIAKTVVKKAILFNTAKFIVYLMNSATVAEMQTENIKRDLLTNSYVRALWGNIKESEFEYAIDEQFSKLAWTAFGRTFVLPRGKQQQIRGLNWNDHRPGLIVVDDLENKEELLNPDLRKKDNDWFFSDVMKSLDAYSKEGVVIYIDTVKHEDSLLQGLLDSPEWHSIRLAICDENYKSYDTNYMTDEEVLAEVNEHRRKGDLDLFYMERMNLPISIEDASFKKEYFLYHDEALLFGRKDIENIVICDPAKTVKIQSADSAIVCWGYNEKENKIHFRDCVSGKMYPDDIYKEAFDMAERLGARVVAFEVTGLEEFIKQPVKTYANNRNFKGELVWLVARGGNAGDRGKIERIKSLMPYYKSGMVTHNQAVSGKLEMQLRSFPKSKLLDVMDAAAYIVEILELGGRYFGTLNEDDSDVASEEEYATLEREGEHALKNWRMM